MPKIPVWNLFPEDLPNSGVRFRMEGGSRHLYTWQPCSCCNRPTVFRVTNHRLDPVLTFFARDVDQGPHLLALSEMITESFNRDHPEPEVLIDFGDLLAEVEMNNIRIAESIRYGQRLTMADLHPHLKRPKSWQFRQ